MAMSDPNHAKVNILMVDDQPAKLLSYEAILQDLNENLIKANSGKEALEHLLKRDIAVVLMDVSMPEIDGFELADMIRQHPRFTKTAIIFISAVHLREADLIQGYQRGAVDYISVPVVPELLRAKVSVFAELHRKSRQLEELNLALRNLSTRLINLQDEERRRIARDLHDGLGQELTAAKMMVDAIPHQLATAKDNAARDASDLIQSALHKTRTISHLLHPPLLDEVGLRSALQWFVEGLKQRSGLNATLELDPPDFPRLVPELETAIFRIVQEGLTNAFRHSGGTKAEVIVTLARSGQLAISIQDDGKGISEDIEQFRADSIGVGIGGMRQRVKEFDGEFRLCNTSPGTLLEVLLPVSVTMQNPPETSPETEVLGSLTRGGSR